MKPVSHVSPAILRPGLSIVSMLLWMVVSGGRIHSAPPVPFTDTDGDSYTVTLAGGGTLAVTQDEAGHPGSGPIDSIALTGTTSASALKVVVKKGDTGDGKVSIGAITSDGARGSIVATASDLIGGGGGIAINGLATSVKLRSIATGASLTFGPSAKPKPLAITTTEGIGNVTITAPGSTLALTALGVAQANITCAQASLLKTTGSSFSANVSTPGKIVALSVKGGDLSSSHIDTLAIGSMSVKKDKGGSGGSVVDSFVAAKTSIGAVIIDGEMLRSYIMAGANFGADREPGGAGANADTFGPGSIRSLIVGGNVTRTSACATSMLRGSSARSPARARSASAAMAARRGRRSSIRPSCSASRPIAGCTSWTMATSASASSARRCRASPRAISTSLPRTAASCIASTNSAAT